MARYIDAEKAVAALESKKLESVFMNDWISKSVLEYTIVAFKVCPTVDAVPVRHGHWIDMGDVCQCSECGSTNLKHFKSYYGAATDPWLKTNYCPSCGADMREERINEVH